MNYETLADFYTNHVETPPLYFHLIWIWHRNGNISYETYRKYLIKCQECLDEIMELDDLILSLPD